MKHWTEKLVDMDACSDAVEWARGYDSLEAAWAACERADWMLWLLGRNVTQDSPEHRRLVTCLCECGRTLLPYAGVLRADLETIYATIEAWTKGEVVDLIAARRAAKRALSAACTAEWSAAECALCAARSTSCSATWNATWSAFSATTVTGVTIVRKHYPFPPDI